VTCDLVLRYIDAYVDCELDPTAQIELERHLAVCADCQERLVLTKHLKAQVRNSLHGMRAPEGLRERIGLALDAAQAAAAAPARDRPLVRWIPIRARYAVPLAVAAGILMVLTWSVGSPNGDVSQASTIPMIEDVVRLHSSQLPPDVPPVQQQRVVSPQQVVRYFRDKVSFPVRPAVFERQDARLVGARLSNVREQRAAALYYDVGGRRLTVVVFRPSRAVELGGLQQRVLGRELHYHQVDGYIVPVLKENGITYAFAGDMDRRSLLRLAATARVRY